jgi:hypothetical protein
MKFEQHSDCKIMLHDLKNTWRKNILITGSTALCFMVTCALPTARRVLFFADESASLPADNVRNEVVTIQRSQEVLKMLPLYAWISFVIVSLKTRAQRSSLQLQHTRRQLSLDGTGLRGLETNSLIPVAIILRVYVSL